MGKRKVTLFVSYARANAALAERLPKALREQTAASASYCTPQQRTRFVEQLYDGIEERLHKLFPRAANVAS